MTSPVVPCLIFPARRLDSSSTITTTSSSSSFTMSQTGPTHHQFGEGYSGHNPVPTVQHFHKEQAAHRAEGLASPPESDGETAVSAPAYNDADIDKDLPPKPAATPAATANDGNKQLSSAAELEAKASPKKGESKAEVMEKANANKMKPTDRLKNSKAERTARDPVTGQDVIIHDAEFSSE